jgi:small subunit ribosomal protein S19
MVKKEFSYRGKTLAQLQAMNVQDFIMLIPANERRHVKRGLTDREKKLLKDLREGKNNVETHARELVVLPEMVGKTLKVHSGKEFVPVLIAEDMLGHRLGEFVMTRKQVRHGAAGVGATRGTAHQSVH